MAFLCNYLQIRKIFRTFVENIRVIRLTREYIIMKRIIYILCVAMLMVACKKEDKSAKLLEDYQALNDRISEELKEVEDPDVADSIITAFIDEAFALQQAQPESEAAYVILEDIFYLLSDGQKAQAFLVLNIDSLEVHGLQRHYDAYIAEQNTAVGMPYTDFAAFTSAGEAKRLSEFVGQSDYLLVDFWASWCGPCRRSMPGLKELLTKYGDKLAIVGISVDEDAEAWQQAVGALELTWPQLRDTNDEGSKAYGIMAIPHTVLIACDGTILAHNPSHEEVAALIK